MVKGIAAAVAAIVVVSLGLGAGCASRRGGAPARGGDVSSGDPAGTTDGVQRLALQPVPGPFRAGLRLRVEPAGERSMTMSGQLRFDFLRQIRLGAHYGAIGPVFALLADRDSCELLFHREKRYWLSARDEPDWGRLNPAAWTRAVEWALAPASLVQEIEFESAGPATGHEGSGAWARSGRLRASGLGIRLRGDAGSGALQDVSLWDGVDPILSIRFESYDRRDEALLPRKLSIYSPRDRLRVDLEILGWAPEEPGGEAASMLRPEGWLPVREGDVPSYLPQP